MDHLGTQYSPYFFFICPQVFVGLGDPFEGPAALEALANGCYFINPKVSQEPITRSVRLSIPYVTYYSYI